MSYSVFAGDKLIGHSDLELGDPPMGVALGKFRAASGYAAIRRDCMSALASGRWDQLQLSVRTQSGETVPAQGGIMILDGEAVALDEVEIQIAGIPYPLYEQLFASHVANCDGLGK